MKGLLLEDRQVIEYTNGNLPEGLVGVFSLRGMMAGN